MPYPIPSCVANDDSEACIHDSNYVACANALKTRTKSTLHMAHFHTLEISAKKSKFRTCTVKHEPYVPITKLETCANRHVACVCHRFKRTSSFGGALEFQETKNRK